jgi:hypothetical protein
MQIAWQFSLAAIVGSMQGIASFGRMQNFTLMRSGQSACHGSNLPRQNFTEAIWEIQ